MKNNRKPKSKSWIDNEIPMMPYRPWLSYRQRLRRKRRRALLCCAAAVAAALFLCAPKEAGSRVHKVPLAIPADARVSDISDFELVASGVTGTVYHAVPEQCDSDVEHTASMFKLDLVNPGKHRIIAVERTMLERYGLSMGDTVLVAGAGELSGFWQIQDVMNKRYAGEDRIDFLVNRDEWPTGKWEDLRIFKMKRDET